MSAPTPQRTAPRAIAITATALGAVIVLGTAGAAAASSAIGSATETSTRTLDVTGVDALSVDVAAVNLDVRFADVEAAQLTVTAPWGAGGWAFDRHDDELVVSSPHSTFGIGWLAGENARATLTLPNALQRGSLDGDLTLSAGRMSVDGSFAELELDVSAGRMQVSGTAEELSAYTSAGRADLDLAGTRTVELSVSAGELNAQLSGAAPQNIEVHVSAGTARLTLPDEDYDVQVDVAAGGVRNALSTSSSATNRITGGVSAGNLVLRPAE